jgi:VWFA-related protein
MGNFDLPLGRFASGNERAGELPANRVSRDPGTELGEHLPAPKVTVFHPTSSGMIGFQGESFMPTLRSVVRVVLLSSLATDLSLSLSLTSQNATPTTTLRVTSNLVFLDVTVVDRKGQPVVSGLTKDNFTIMENGKPQRIFSFDAPAASEKTRETASTNTTVVAPATILVLDLLNTPNGDSANARDGIRQFLLLQAERLPSQTELMVLNNTALNLAVAYTHNRNELLSALKHVRPETPYKLRGGDWADERLAQSIEALQQIALQNKGSPGRKNILWVGQGGPNIPIDPADPGYDRHVGFFAHGTTNMLVDARISLFLIRPGGVKGAGNPDLFRIEGREVPKQKDLEDFDPFAKTVNFGLFIRGTGGKFFDNRNDVVRAIAEAQDLGSNYYTLTYQPQVGEKDGKFRKIEVVMRERNLRAMTKTGYYAPEPTSKSDPTQNHVDPAIEIDEAAQSGFLIDSLGMSLVNAERHPDSQTVEVKTLLKSTHLRWQSTDDGRSTSDITVEAVSLSKKREILASRMRRLTIFSDSQDPARLAASETPVTFIVPVPPHTEEVRLIILAQDGGQLGTLELAHEALVSAPESPSPIPQLQPRPAGTSQPHF